MIQEDPLERAVDIVARGFTFRCFGCGDGSLSFTRGTVDPQRLAKRILNLTFLLQQHRELIDCAAGACDGDHPHVG